MKLLYCPVCRDVHGIIEETWRKCLCGQSGGQYNEDGMTATLGGLARVFGVGNFPFFDELFIHLTDEKKAELRLKYYNGPSDAWWGDYPGEVQIFHVDDPNGPRLEIKVKQINLRQNQVTIVDKREWYCVGLVAKDSDGRALENKVIVPRNPAFKAKTRWRQNEDDRKHLKDCATPEEALEWCQKNFPGMTATSKKKLTQTLAPVQSVITHLSQMHSLEKPTPASLNLAIQKASFELEKKKQLEEKKPTPAARAMEKILKQQKLDGWKVRRRK